MRSTSSPRDPWWQENAESLKGKALPSLRATRSHAFLLLRVLRDGWRLDRVIDEVLTPVRDLPTSIHTVAQRGCPFTAAQTSTALAVARKTLRAEGCFRATRDRPHPRTVGSGDEARRRSRSGRGSRLSSRLEAEQENVHSCDPPSPRSKRD